jgi:hypothetical protein
MIEAEAESHGSSKNPKNIAAKTIDTHKSTINRQVPEHYARSENSKKERD